MRETEKIRIASTGRRRRGESLERWAVGGWQGQIISHTTHSTARDNRSPHS
jgi:hypothetical protein